MTSTVRGKTGRSSDVNVWAAIGAVTGPRSARWPGLGQNPDETGPGANPMAEARRGRRRRDSRAAKAWGAALRLGREGKGQGRGTRAPSAETTRRRAASNRRRRRGVDGASRAAGRGMESWSCVRLADNERHATQTQPKPSHRAQTLQPTDRSWSSLSPRAAHGLLARLAPAPRPAPHPRR